MYTNKATLGLLALMLGAGLAACGGSGTTGSPAGGGSEATAPGAAEAPTAAGSSASEPVNYEVTTLDTLKDGFSPATISAAPGQMVKLTLNNSAGALEHSWVLVKKDVSVDDAKLIMRGSDEGQILYTLEVKPAEKASGEFTAPAEAGDYVVICHIPGHAAAGMIGTLTVK